MTKAERSKKAGDTVKNHVENDWASCDTQAVNVYVLISFQAFLTFLTAGTLNHGHSGMNKHQSVARPSEQWEFEGIVLRDGLAKAEGLTIATGGNFHEKPVRAQKKPLKTFIDLFCGIGGFHVAGSDLGLDCVFASDIDHEARKAYQHNFGLMPQGDITLIPASDIPDHDILCAGFPCQPFSIIGARKGFGDPRGTLFHEIIRIIEEKQPKAVLLENVRQLSTINNGQVLGFIRQSLENLGYHADSRILNALHFGLPHKRERTLIVATRDDIGPFAWPDTRLPMTPLAKLLEEKPAQKHMVSDKIRQSRHQAHRPSVSPSIWHENKSGNVSSHPFSCALRAGASYNYLLVDGERRLTPREMLRLQGFPDTFEIICNDSQTRKQAGNSVPVPMIRSVMERLLDAFR